MLTSGDGVGLLRLKQAAQLLGVSVRKVYRLIAEGELPKPIKIGRSSRFEFTDIQQFIERQKRRRRQG